MLNVNRLRMLREVAARGTIAAAADALYMTPSAVSQQMAVLEREAGTAVLERHGRGVRLTTAGERLLQHTERVLAELERAQADLAAASVGVVGRVRVSAFPTAARTLLVPAIVDLEASEPNLRISMVDLEPEDSLPQLKAGDLDVVVTYEWDTLPTVADAGIEREQLFSEPVYLALAPEHPMARRRSVRMTELADEEWIVGRDSTSMMDLIVVAARNAGFEAKTDFHSMDFEVILSAVSAGLGVALVPPLALMGPHVEVAIVELKGINMNRNIYASIRRGSGGNPGIAVVLDTLRRVSEQLTTKTRELRAPKPENAGLGHA